MGNILRSVNQDNPVKDQNISANLTSKRVNIGDYEGRFGIHVKWGSGTSVDMNIYLEISNTGQDGEYVVFGGSNQNITGDSGNHFWDIDTGANFIRVVFEVNSGNADFNVLFNGKQRV